MKQGIKRFFKYARDRHQITLNRAAGMPRDKWTKDPIFQQFRFTCVFRELDKTTAWFRKNVRERVPVSELLLATVVFRLLNRIEVGEAVFCQTDLLVDKKRTAFDAFLKDGNVNHLKNAIVHYCGPKGPYVTGAYIISSPKGYSKLDGVLEVIKRFNHESRDYHLVSESFDPNIIWPDATQLWLSNPGDEWNTLENAWKWLSQFDYLGKFHAYEIVTDLRHTALLNKAPDIMSWANPGPGARRGLNRIHGRELSHKPPRAQQIEEMQYILSCSWDASCWPQPRSVDGSSCGDGNFDRRMQRADEEHNANWPAWEIRDVEHTLCEFDKYERVRLGEGRPRGVYR